MQHTSNKILIVDDDEAILRLLRGLLQSEYRLAEATTGEQALEMLPSFRPDLVLLDIMMPGIDGHETCRRIRSSPFGHRIQVMMVSARSSRDEQARAYEAGADDYVVKPFDPQELYSRVRLHFRLCGGLDTIASATSDSNSRLGTTEQIPAKDMAHFHDVIVAALIKVAAFRDVETGEHLVRMCSYAQIVAEELCRDSLYADEIDEQFLNDLHRASPLHDIGKVGISDAILLKPGAFTSDEFETMKQHTTIGANILEQLAFESLDVSFLRMAAAVARFHHERFDGSGYPAGLVGTETPLPARIIALADAFDAITSVRCYKDPLPAEAAREIIEQDSGSHFDPVVVEAFLRRFDTMVSVQKQIQDRAPVVIGAVNLQSELLMAAGG